MATEIDPCRATLPLENEKFLLDENGKTAVRTVITEFLGTITTTASGLSVAGKITEVTLNSTTWTALPVSALANRNGIGIQNENNIKIKLNFDNTETGFVGWSVNALGETFIDITDSVVIYAKAESGNPVITLMEVA